QLVDRLPPASPVLARAELSIGALDERLGRYADARRWFDTALARPGAHTFEALLALARLDRRQGALDDGLGRCAAALELARPDGDAVRESLSLGELGRMLQSMGRYRDAQAHHEAAMAIQRAHRLDERHALERSLHARATHRAG